MTYFIGIDIGTSAAKLLLVDEQGVIQNVVSKEYSLEMPQPGWSQQNPEDWKIAILEAIPELLNGFDSSKVIGIGAGGQMHGLVALDADDMVIRPAILWNDGRTSEQTDWLNREIGKERLTSLTGNIAFAGFTAPKLMWLKQQEPENFKRVAKIMLPKDYIVYWLTGVHASEHSDASGTLLYDVKNRCWSKEMLDICGIVTEQMPKLFESSDAVGTLRPELAKQFGLSENTIVCAGAADNAAAAVGSGIVGEGKCNISLGTSGTVFITSRKFSVDPNNALHSFAHADGGFCQLGCILSAAGCQKWWLENILKTDDYSAEQNRIKKLGENNVFYLPYLMGERSPHNDTYARGAFVGMSMDTNRAVMTQAVLEGVSFAIRDCVEAAKKQGIVISESMICGGGARSQLWRKIMANVLGIRLIVPRTEQGPAYGGAILAAVAAGKFASVKECCSRWVTISDSINPDSDLLTMYDRVYYRWKKLYPALKEYFRNCN
jgi:xylulokinase